MANPVITLILDAKNLASPQLKGLQKDLKGVETSTARMGVATNRAGLLLKGMVGAGVIGAAWGLANALVEGAQGAIEEEASIARLNAALKANVPAWDGSTVAIERAAKAAMDFGFADDEVRDSITRLIPATRDVTAALALQRTAMDLARLKGISLADASDALVKVEAGQYRMLKSLGIVLKDGATQTEALAEVQRVAAGQMEAYAETTAGKLDRIKVAWQEIEETAGGALVNSVDVVDQIGDAWDDATASLQGFIDTLPKSELTLRREAEAARELRERLHYVGKSLGDVNEQIDRGRPGPGWTRMRALTKDIDKYLRDIVDAADDARDALFGASKGPEETRLSLKKAKLEGKDLRDELAELEKKKPTREVRQDIVDTKLAIIDNKEEVITLQGQLVTMGKVDLSAHEKNIKDLGYGWGDAKDELADYLRLLSVVPGVKIPKPKARSVFNYEGKPEVYGDGGWAGLHGPELAILGDRGPEYVIPNHALGRATGGGPAMPGGVTLVVNSAWPPTPAQVREFADAVDAEFAQRRVRWSPA